MIYFTADLHLGHENVLKLSARPFSSIEEMDATLINNWNARVKKGDTVYILGDLIFRSKTPEDYLKALNGKKILILGNHDNNWMTKCDYANYFEKISKYEELNLFSRIITLCHYPMLEWRNSRKEGSSKLGYMIHGHIHNNIHPEYEALFKTPNVLNAGVDVNGFYPVTFEEMIANNEEYKIKALKELHS